jgi:predicted acetyltransferase
MGWRMNNNACNDIVLDLWSSSINKNYVFIIGDGCIGFYLKNEIALTDKKNEEISA